MSAADELLLMSLGLNGIWLAKVIIRWACDNASRLVGATLVLFGLMVLSGLGVLVLHLSGEWLIANRVVTGVAVPACLWCCYRLMDLLPRPWGNATKKRKLR